MKLALNERRVADALDHEAVSQFDQQATWHFLRQMRAHDAETYQHSLTVGLIACDLAHLNGLDAKTALLSGLLHDVGKITIPTSILNKQGALSDEDWEVIRNHPRASYSILKGRFPIIADIALIHHQFQDNPYPRVRSPMKHTEYGNLISTADFYDAIISRNNARGNAAHTIDAVLDRFTKHREHQIAVIHPLVKEELVLYRAA